MANTIKRVGGEKRTVVALNSRMSDAFVPGWDKAPGAQQQLARVKRRADMGLKKTPVGRSVLRRK